MIVVDMKILRTPALWLVYALLSSFSVMANAKEIEYNVAPTMGGIGEIDRDVFVSVRSDVNRLILGPIDSKQCKTLAALPSCRRKWVGGDTGTTQIILTDGVHVSESNEKGLDLTKLIIVMYYPKEIRFINLRTNTSGKFSR